jgi:hypothetical protein
VKRTILIGVALDNRHDVSFLLKFEGAFSSIGIGLMPRTAFSMIARGAHERPILENLGSRSPSPLVRRQSTAQPSHDPPSSGQQIEAVCLFLRRRFGRNHRFSHYGDGLLMCFASGMFTSMVIPAVSSVHALSALGQ